MHRYKELKIWQESMKLVESVYQHTSSFPHDEKFGLTNQIRRSAVSIPSNIAEGAGRNSSKDFAHFLTIAMGSTCELQTQLELATRLSFLAEEDFVSLENKIEYISNMNYKLRESLLSNSLNEPEVNNYNEIQS